MPRTAQDPVFTVKRTESGTFLSNEVPARLYKCNLFLFRYLFFIIVIRLLFVSSNILWIPVDLVCFVKISERIYITCDVNSWI